MSGAADIGASAPLPGSDPLATPAPAAVVETPPAPAPEPVPAAPPPVTAEAGQPGVLAPGAGTGDGTAEALHGIDEAVKPEPVPADDPGYVTATLTLSRNGITASGEINPETGRGVHEVEQRFRDLEEAHKQTGHVFADAEPSTVCTKCGRRQWQVTAGETCVPKTDGAA